MIETIRARTFAGGLVAGVLGIVAGFLVGTWFESGYVSTRKPDAIPWNGVDIKLSPDEVLEFWPSVSSTYGISYRGLETPESGDRGNWAGKGRTHVVVDPMVDALMFAPIPSPLVGHRTTKRQVDGGLPAAEAGVHCLRMDFPEAWVQLYIRVDGLHDRLVYLGPDSRTDRFAGTVSRALDALGIAVSQAEVSNLCARANRCVSRTIARAGDGSGLQTGTSSRCGVADETS